MNYPVIKAEIAKFSSDGFRRSSRGLGQEVEIGLTRTLVVRDIDDARDLALAALPEESRYLSDGDYIAFRTFVDYGPSYGWMGEKEQYRFDHVWERLSQDRDCGDSGCRYAKRPLRGVRTQGGKCRCNE